MTNRYPTFGKRSALVALAICALAGATTPEALALTVATTTNAATLATAVQNGSSGITVIGGSEALQGSAVQQGTYTGFSLAPTSGTTPTLNLPDGIVLSSGNAIVNNANTVNETTVVPGSGSDVDLLVLSGFLTNDANTLRFDFTVSGGNNAVSAQFVFGTEEFPTQTVTDIFGFFVDGINYAQFPNGDLIANTPGNPTNFIDNPVGAGLYGIEYNGLTRVLTVTGLLDMNLSTHTIMIGIADTLDSRYDSGVYIANLQAITTGGDGGIDVPEAGTVGLFDLGLVGLGLAARRRKAA